MSSRAYTPEEVKEEIQKLKTSNIERDEIIIDLDEIIKLKRESLKHTSRMEILDYFAGQAIPPIVINLEEFRNLNSKVFLGRDNGQCVRRASNIDLLEMTYDNNILIIIPDDIYHIVNHS